MEPYCTYLFLSQCYAYAFIFQYKKECQEWAGYRSACVEQLHHAPLEVLGFLIFFFPTLFPVIIINMVIVATICVIILFYLISIIKLLLSPPESFTFFWFSSPSHFVGVGGKNWASTWVALNCWLGLNNDRQKGFICTTGPNTKFALLLEYFLNLCN